MRLACSPFFPPFSSTPDTPARFHPDIDAEAQFEIENAHVGLWQSDTAASTINDPCPETRAVTPAAEKTPTQKPAKTQPASHHSKSPRGFVPMNVSEFMHLDSRASCLEHDHKPSRGQPFTTLERDAQLSFIMDNPSLPLGSRKTWDVYAPPLPSVYFCNTSPPSIGVFL